MREHGGEAGAGLVGTVGGVGVFLGFLLLAAHVLVHLYAVSTVTAVAFDVARVVAGADGGPAAEARAEAEARRLLGRVGETASFEWSYVDVDGDQLADEVRLRLEAGPTSRLLPAVGGQPFLGAVDRTVSVRLERWR